MLRRDGCHHCGKRKGNIVADHIPPNKMVKAQSGLPALEQPLKRAVAGLPAPWRDFACAPFIPCAAHCLHQCDMQQVLVNIDQAQNGVCVLKQLLKRTVAGLPAPWRDFACALSYSMLEATLCWSRCCQIGRHGLNLGCQS